MKSFDISIGPMVSKEILCMGINFDSAKSHAFTGHPNFGMWHSFECIPCRCVVDETWRSFTFRLG